MLQIIKGFKFYNPNHPLEYRVFSSFVFLGAFLAGSFTINSQFNGAPILIRSINFGCFVLLLFIHYFSFRKSWNVRLRFVFFPLITLAIIWAWTGNVGYLSSNNATFLLLYTTLLGVINFNKKAFIFSFSYYFIVTAFLFYYDYFFIEHIGIDPDFYEKDIKTKAIVWQLVGVSITFLIYSFRSAYINERLKLQIANQKLQEVSNELAASNEELMVQGEELLSQRDTLDESNKIIQQQKDLLALRNADLEKLVDERTSNLTRTNLQLSRQNRKLEEFSFVLAHKLKGPLASMKGLQLLEKMNGSDLETIFPLIEKQTEILNDIIEDLNHIIHLKEDTVTEPQWLNLSELFSTEIKRMLSHFKLFDVKIYSHLQVKEVFIKKPHLVDLIGEVLLNSFQFRDDKRELEISISSYKKSDALNILIIDNGRGFSANELDDKLFQLYQVFDLDRGGRGLGLYIARLEAGFLGGNILLNSQMNVGTAVRIQIPIEDGVKVKP